jgi:hypothetical protein
MPAAGSVQIQQVQLTDNNGQQAQWGSWGDTTGAGVRALLTGAESLVFDGTFFERLRTPVIFKSTPISAVGSTAVWTPAGGKKFRLMAYMIEVPGGATLAALGIETIALLDAAGAIGISHQISLPNAADAVNRSSPWVILGNGILSAVANNVLNGNLATVLAAGAIVVHTAGTEE